MSITKQNLKHITGKGVGFAASGTPVKKEYAYSGKQRLPEQIYPEDMVEVKNSDEETFTRDSRPYRFFFAVEKSMYDAISREMLEMFASIKDFNNLIGEPQEGCDHPELRGPAGPHEGQHRGVRPGGVGQVGGLVPSQPLHPHGDQDGHCQGLG